MVTLAEASPRHANIKKPVFWDLNGREVAIGLDIDRVESARTRHDLSRTKVLVRQTWRGGHHSKSSC